MAQMWEWEYRIEVRPAANGMLESELKQIGLEGWELVTITVHGDSLTSWRFYFKRPAP